MLNLFLVLLTSTLSLHPATTENVFHKIVPLLTKKINPEQPTDSEQTLINGATAFLKHSTNQTSISPEMVQTIASVGFYTDILSQYLTTTTVSGTLQAALITTQLTDDITVLNQRQAFIKYLSEHPDIALQLQQLFAQTVSAESHFFRLFQPINPETTEAHKQSQARLYFTSETCKTWNNYPYILGGMKRAKLFLPTLTFANPLIQAALFIKAEKNISFIAALGVAIAKSPQIVSFISANWDNIPTPGKGFIIGLPVIMAVQLYQLSKEVKIDFDLIHDQQKSLIEIAQLIHGLKRMEALLRNNPELQALLSKQYQKLHELFNSASPELKDLIENLSSSSFLGSDSYLFSKQGKILATHYKLSELKGELIPYLEAFGTIDAYLAAAKLYQTYQNHPRVTFCLPSFVDAPVPALGALEFWHPLINPDTVVTNDITMSARTVRNMMITGPNAGGKTTSLMALIINIIFAQSFAIAPSKALTLTPFAKIHSYLDITTNLQEGLSLFAAEVDRAKKLKTSIASCTPGQKTFTIIDEIFSGTDPKVASDIGSKFAKQLGEMHHSMTIITTHFPKLTEIEQENGSFTNYKVADATIEDNGTITYPFKLVPGISTQNIAQHMLENEGII